MTKATEDRAANAINAMDEIVATLESARKRTPAEFASHPGKPGRNGKMHQAVEKLLGNLKTLTARLEALR